MALNSHDSGHVIDLKARMEERDLDRRRDMETKRLINAEGKSKQENADVFATTFAKDLLSLKELFKEQISQPSEENVSRISKSLSALQTLLSESSLFLPSRMMEKSQTQLKDAQLEFKMLQAQSAPKKKFKFSKRTEKKTLTASDSNSTKPVAQSSLPEVSSEMPPVQSLEGLADVVIHSRRDETIHLSREQISSKDILFQDISSCRLILEGFPATVHMNKVTGSTILSGPVCQSVFIDGAKDCTFVIMAQQFRIHRTNKCEFYIHVTSKAIIEDCHDLAFAPYAHDYQNLNDDIEKSGLSKETNNWDKVDDFFWLSSQKASPNWSIIPENDRKTFA